MQIPLPPQRDRDDRRSMAAYWRRTKWARRFMRRHSSRRDSVQKGRVLPRLAVSSCAGLTPIDTRWSLVICTAKPPMFLTRDGGRLAGKRFAEGPPERARIVAPDDMTRVGNYHDVNPRRFRRGQSLPQRAPAWANGVVELTINYGNLERVIR